VTGRLDGNFVVVAEGSGPDTMFNAPRANGKFRISDGSVSNIDLVAVMQSDAAGSRAGVTKFAELAGDYAGAEQRAAYRNVALQGGVLRGNGSFEVGQSSVLTGRATLHDISRRSGHDLPPASWALLEHLDQRGALRVSDIAACHGVDVSSITPRLKALEQSGLVVRESLTSAARRERLLERFARGHFPIVIRTVLEGFANGALDSSLPPFVVATAIISLGALPPVAHRIVGGHLPLPGPKSAEDLPAELVRALFSGIASASKPFPRRSQF
jgi:hypothetical protein